MKNEKLIRILGFALAAILHILIILFLAVSTEKNIMEEEENARVMKLTDIDELPPPPPEPEIPRVEEIAETVIETETPPVQIIVPAGTLTIAAPEEPEEYLPMHQVSQPPQFDANAILSELVYPPIALRSGIEGRVILELFVDRTGTVQRVIILREDPEDRGFGEAAVRAFTNRKGEPAYANGEPVSSRYRYPLTFRIR